MIAKFASDELRQGDEMDIHHDIVGARFKRIEIRLTKQDYVDPEVQRWVRTLFTRADYLDRTPLVITVII